MSLSKPTANYRYSEQFGNGSHTGRRRIPIACRVCDRVFFDNVSLVLHFECHLTDTDLESLQSEQRLSSGRSPCSYSSFGEVFQRMDDCSRSRPSAIPVLNVSQPITCPPYAAAAVTPPLREQNVRQTCFPGYENQEIIVLSDDDDEEEEENKCSVEIDLTLKL
ncbi:hypothetical protein SASPL_113461 [Salvia splendens]|uniref:C2H2-type domain-containing protein n=1 Tax=Salvia splendens TaxID=180675 RepID=A0A8X8ZYE0_SALSN|nr:hypothetical protein SASPL_113461 [Salvia splendens]